MSGIFLRSGYLDSARVARLSPFAERFYVHLLLITPGTGVFEVDYKILKERCFPNLDDVTAYQIRDWIIECKDAELLRIEKVSGQKFVIRVLRHESKHDADETSEEKTAKEPETCLSFNEFWDMYGRKIERRKCEMRYAKISETDRVKIKEVLPAYVAATPDVKYRKFPATWLNNRGWEDDISALSAVKTDTDAETEGF